MNRQKLHSRMPLFVSQYYFQKINFQVFQDSLSKNHLNPVHRTGFVKWSLKKRELKIFSRFNLSRFIEGEILLR